MTQRDQETVALAEVTRGGLVESVHRGAAVVVRHGEVLHAWGDIGQRTFTRSCIKPLQALPTLERGILDRIHASEPEFAVMIASHDGTAEHVEVVRGLMAKAGVREEHLLCGPHAPYNQAASLAIARAGKKPERVHNNCSGKHTGFLALARELGVAPERYLDPESEPQRLVRQAIADMLELPASDLPTAIDGCGASTFHVPLTSLARAFAKLATPSGLSIERAHACRRMLAAVTNWPRIFSGEERLCHALISAAPGKLFPKNGAEGVYCVGVVGTGVGVAVKVADGHERGYMPVVVDILTKLGLWSRLPHELERFARVPIYNTQKIVVGHVESALDWSTT